MSDSSVNHQIWIRLGRLWSSGFHTFCFDNLTWWNLPYVSKLWRSQFILGRERELLMWYLDTRKINNLFIWSKAEEQVVDLWVCGYSDKCLGIIICWGACTMVPLFITKWGCTAVPFILVIWLITYRTSLSQAFLYWRMTLPQRACFAHLSLFFLGVSHIGCLLEREYLHYTWKRVKGQC